MIDRARNARFVARAYGEDINRVVDFVEDFAEIGPYFDVPLSTYSSGMVQRVAYGLSMAIDFDCYLIDETMAVGDGRFRDRCEEQFEMRKNRSDLIMTSHSMAISGNIVSEASCFPAAKLLVFRGSKTPSKCTIGSTGELNLDRRTGDNEHPRGGKPISAPRSRGADAISSRCGRAARKAHRTNGSWLQVASTGRRWAGALIPASSSASW